MNANISCCQVCLCQVQKIKSMIPINDDDDDRGKKETTMDADDKEMTGVKGKERDRIQRNQDDELNFVNILQGWKNCFILNLHLMIISRLSFVVTTQSVSVISRTNDSKKSSHQEVKSSDILFFFLVTVAG